MRDVLQDTLQVV